MGPVQEEPRGQEEQEEAEEAEGDQGRERQGRQEQQDQQGRQGQRWEEQRGLSSSDLPYRSLAPWPTIWPGPQEQRDEHGHAV